MLICRTGSALNPSFCAPTVFRIRSSLRLIIESHSARPDPGFREPPQIDGRLVGDPGQKALPLFRGTTRALKGTTVLTREYSRRFGWQGNSLVKFI